MSINKQLQKRMLDLDVKGAKQLSELSGVSYAKTLRIIKGDGTVRIKDVVTIAESIGLEFKFIIKGE